MRNKVQIIFLVVLTISLFGERKFQDQQYNDLANIFPPSEKNIDVVVFVDVSGSMSDVPENGQAAKKAVIEIINSLEADDYFSCYRFGRNVSQISNRGIVGNLDIPQFTSTITNLEMNEDKTDIGLALEKALEECKRDNARKIQLVFLLTDGQHIPAEGSKYKDPEAFDRLSEEAKQIMKHRIVYAIGLGISNGGKTGVSLVSQVFPNSITLTTNANGLANEINRIVSDMNLKIIELLAKNDIENGSVGLFWKDEKLKTSQNETENTDLMIFSTYKYLPIELDDIKLEANLSTVVELPDNPTLIKPGDTINAKVTIPIPETGNKFSLKTENRISVSNSARVSGKFAHSEALERRGIQPVFSEDTEIENNLVIKTSSGISLFIIILVLVIALIILLILRRRYKMRHPKIPIAIFIDDEKRELPGYKNKYKVPGIGTIKVVRVKYGEIQFKIGKTILKENEPGHISGKSVRIINL